MITTVNPVFSLHQVKMKEAFHKTLEKFKCYSSFVDRTIDLVILIFSLKQGREKRTRLKPQQEKMINHFKKIQRKIKESKTQRLHIVTVYVEQMNPGRIFQVHIHA